MLCRMLRQPVRRSSRIEVRLGRRLNSSLKYREFVRARLSPGPDGVPVATPLNRGAGVVTSFVKADCILDIPQNAEGAEKGGLCRARLLRPLEDLEHTLAIVDSHDPLLDEAADLLRRAGSGFSASSTHVGSMGAVTAIKGGEAVMGAVHLLDEETGAYNVPQLRRFFPDGRAVLVECVQRTQGLMAAPGNPMGLRDLDDIIRTGARYVNRQRGAGTRILCDYLLKQAGREPSQVNGYTREELTHTAVAAQIAAGTADAGLGIYSAAKLYVGLIRPISHKFCAQCQRIRIDSSGTLRPCLHSTEGIALRGLHGKELENAIRAGILRKPREHMISAEKSAQTQMMYQIGG